MGQYCPQEGSLRHTSHIHTSHKVLIKHLVHITIVVLSCVSVLSWLESPWIKPELKLWQDTMSYHT
jgi:hypothetical protein